MPSQPCRRFRCVCRVQVFTSLMLCAAAGSAVAHAIVTWSSLRETSVLVQTPTTAVIRFNASIELTFTQVLLLSADGQERLLEFAPGAGPGEVAVKLPPLPPGAYALRYRVLGGDGHFTKDILRFRVHAPR